MGNAAEKPVEIKKINEIFDINKGARVRTWLGICSRCGLCAEGAYSIWHTIRIPG